jgi:hypothetical protein
LLPEYSGIPKKNSKFPFSPIAKFGYSSALVDDFLVQLPHPKKKKERKKKRSQL